MQRARDEHAAELSGVLRTLAVRAEEAGELTAAVAWTRRRLEVEPLAEAPHRELIRLLALGGDRPAALAAARAMSEWLRSELGIPPSPETRALVEDVRRGSIARPAATSAPPLPAVLAATEHPEGRGPALAQLERAWADVASGPLSFALVTGEPGIGKTTLAGALARRAHAHEGAVLLGRSDERALVPFQPWIEALEGLLEALPPTDVDHWLSAHDGALARLLPARSPAHAAVGGPRERYLAFELVRALLDETAARRPVLLVLDDVHWADPDSLSLLRHLARSGPRRRLLVVLCARSTELEPAVTQTLAELRREARLLHVELAGLDEHAVAALLARRTGASDDESARRYLARSGGNPLFLDELLRAGGDAEGPPTGVREAFARRLARLGDATARALEAAAVCGHEFDATTLAGVEGRSVVEVLEALDGAIEAGLIAATDRRGRYAFSHALVRETIVAALPASRRALLHAQVADVLEDRNAGAGEIVRHLREAGPLTGAERLATCELAAAREAAAALAHSDAAAHYEAALAVPVTDSERGEVLLALGDAHDRAGRRRGQARAAFAEAAELARVAGDSDLLARAALGHGGVAVVIAAPDPAAVGLLEEALEATSAGEAATSARLLAQLSVELYYSDRARARELSALAVEHARRADDAAALAAALNARRVALWAPQHADERLATADDMIAAAEAVGDREAVLQGRNWRVVDLLELGRVPEAAAEVDAYEALADAVALPHFRWYVPLWRATLALFAGRWSKARELSERALALGAQADDPNAPIFVGIQREHSLYVQGRLREANRTRIAAGGAASPAAAEWRVHLALIDAETGATEDARKLVSELARDDVLAMDANWHGACILAEAAVHVADRDAGAALYGLLEPHARLFPVVARAVGCIGSAEHYVGRLAGLLARHDEAVTRLRHAVAENDRVGAGPYAAASLLRLGEALAASGEHDSARDILEQAVARAETLDMPVVAANAARLLASTAA